MIVRPMTSADLSAVIRIDSESGGTWSETQWYQEAAIANGLRLIALVNDMIVALVCFRIVDHESELLRLAVRLENRRQGIGAMLLQQGLAMLCQHDVQCCFLEVRQSNHGALKLYEGLGFTRMGTRPRYYREPVEHAVLMRKDLEPGREAKKA